MKGVINPASRMRYRLTLQQRETEADGAGGYSTAWSDVADLWAEVKAVSTHEIYQFGQLRSRSLYKIIIRCRENIRSDMRFIDGSRVFYIRGIFCMETEGLMELLTEEGEGE